MTQNKDRKAKIRARMAQSGEPYTEAARHVDAREPSAAELAGRGVADAEARAAAYADGDHSWEAHQARLDLDGVEWWETRRRGRPVRLWEAVIETRTSALDLDDAIDRLGIDVRRPVHRAVDSDGDNALLVQPWDIGDKEGTAGPYHRELREIDPARLSAVERRHLLLDYPAAAAHLTADRGPYSPLQDAYVSDYVASLLHGRRRLLGRLSAGQEAEIERQREAVLSAGISLTFWRCHHMVLFLAGPDLASARARAAELAATVVDYAGRPVGRVVSVRPDDGFASAVDGLWCHPADQGGFTTSALFNDFDLAERTTGDAAVIADLLQAAARALNADYAREHAEYADYEARLHTQSDGSRTLSTPAALASVADQVRERYRDSSPAELLEEAAAADYLADRVYSKASETDWDVKRIERTRHKAKILRGMAGEAGTRDAGR